MLLGRPRPLVNSRLDRPLRLLQLLSPKPNALLPPAAISRSLVLLCPLALPKSLSRPAMKNGSKAKRLPKKRQVRYVQLVLDLYGCAISILQGIVKIEDEPELPLIQSGSITRKFTNAHLPPNCEKGFLWRRVFIPTYLTFAATYSDPWCIGDEDAVKAMQAAWNAVYIKRIPSKDIPHTVEVNQAVFGVVSRLMYASIVFMLNYSVQPACVQVAFLLRFCQPCNRQCFFRQVQI